MNQVYNFGSFTVTRLAHHQQCSVLPVSSSAAVEILSYLAPTSMTANGARGEGFLLE